MSKKRGKAASSSGSPMEDGKPEPASSKTQIALFATSEAGRICSYCNKAGATLCPAHKLFTSRDGWLHRECFVELKKLSRQPPKPANGGSSAMGELRETFNADKTKQTDSSR